MSFKIKILIVSRNIYIKKRKLERAYMAGEDLDYFEEEKEVFKFSFESTAKPFEAKTKSQGKLDL